MPSSLQGLAVLVVAVLPGAIYMWGFEREAGKWSIGLADTILRFVAASAFFLAVFAYPLYRLYTAYLHDDAGPGKAVNEVSNGTAPWYIVIFVPLFYVLIPALVGTAAGASVRSKHPCARKLARVVAGRDPAPRAWDDLFADRPAGLLRIRLKENGSWVGGQFGAASYASGYPEEPMDLLLEKTYRLDEDGRFEEDANGYPVPLGSKLLIRWDEIGFLEFIPEEA